MNPNCSEFKARRLRLLSLMQAQGGGVAIIPSAREVIRNSDNHYPFRHDSYFYYLSGFMEPDAVLVLVATAEQAHSVLFCREKNPEREIWDGFRYGPAAAQEAYALDAAWPLSVLTEKLADYLANAATVFYSNAAEPRLDSELQQSLFENFGFEHSVMRLQS